MPRAAEWDARWWSPIINAEHLAMRDRAAIVDLSAFAIFDVTGPGACAYLERLCVNKIDVAPGRTVYTPLLNPAGGILADLTIMRLAHDRFRVVTGGGMGMRDRKLFADALPDDGSAQLHDATNQWTTIGLWGPRARDILAGVTSADVSHAGFPFLTTKTVDIDGVRTLASRISYVGELGWEIYVPIEQGLRVWDAIWEAGQPHGMVAAGIGTYAVTARLEKGYRAHGAELELDFDLVEAGMARPTVKDADFVGKAAYLEQRSRPPAAILCTLTVDDPTSSSGVKRYMLGREPILTPDGRPLVDAKGRRSYVTSAGSGPSVGKHLLMAYLPPEQAVEGTRLAVEYFGERYPVTVAVAGAHAAVRSRQHPDPELSGRRMEILVCVKRVPGDRRPDRPDARRPGDRHPLPRLHGQPARGVRGRGGRPDRRGPGRIVDRADARARRPPRSSSATRWPSGIDRAILLETDGREFDPIATSAAIVETIRAQEAAHGPFDLILFGNEAADTGDFQVGIRVAVALDRPVVTGIKSLAVARRRRVRAARGDRRRLGDLRGAAAGGPVGQGGAQPAALPVGPGPASGEAQGDRADRAGLVAERGGQARPAAARGGGRPGRDPGPRTGRGAGRRGPAGPDRGARVMSGVLVFVEHAAGEVDRLSREALVLAGSARGRRPAARSRRSCSGRSRGRRAGRSARYGVATVHVVDDSRLEAYAPAAWGAAIVELVGGALAGRRHRRWQRPGPRGPGPRRRPNRAADGRQRGRGRGRRAVAADPPALGRQPARGRGADAGRRAADGRARTWSPVEDVAGSAARPARPSRRP